MTWVLLHFSQDLGEGRCSLLSKRVHACTSVFENRDSARLISGSQEFDTMAHSGLPVCIC